MRLNEEQVITALECCGNKVKADCANCPMDEKRGCAIELYSKALAVIKQTRADTARKMQTEIKERCIKGGIYPAFVASTINRVVEEFVEGK